MAILKRSGLSSATCLRDRGSSGYDKDPVYRAFMGMPASAFSEEAEAAAEAREMVHDMEVADDE